MRKIIQFGENVDGYEIPGLNEREIRAAAGLLFLGALLSFMLILFKGEFFWIKYFITGFLIDFIIRVFINPRFSPTLIVGRLIVRNQVPEYVGAKQKRFSWMIGIFLSGLMFSFLVVVNAYSPITGISCLICLLFLFFEASFGICLGCKFYKLFYRERAQYCPGEVCDVRSRTDIQRTSIAEFLVVVLFVVSIIMTATYFKDYYNRIPYDLFAKAK